MNRACFLPFLRRRPASIRGLDLVPHVVSERRGIVEEQLCRVMIHHRFNGADRQPIADRCLHGVDINPMAVEMAKLSIWLITLQRNRPFTFLDHALSFKD